ncbi:anthranilate synthase component I [bacterium]|nr:anthranilate synthase component I [bacterium]
MAPRQLHVRTQTISGDLDTPVSAYLKLAPSPGFLLESVVGGESVARYSIIGCLPVVEYIASPDGVSIIEGSKQHIVRGKALDIIESEFNQIRPTDPVGPFPNGLFGYANWEIIDQIETIHLTDKPGIELPLARYMIPGALIVFDHAKRTITIVAQSLTSMAACDDIIAKILDQLNQPSRASRRPAMTQSLPRFDSVHTSVSYDEFESMVKRSASHIHDGDVFQMVLSLRFEVESTKHPFDAYRDLRLLNPSPYMFYFDYTDYQLVGSSPEILVKLTHGHAHLRPIAGTRPRDPNRDPVREDALVKDLLADDKEVAEHIMLVDLGRNDLGRVCETVRVTEMMTIEKYSHVMHIVSHVEGKLRPSLNGFDLFKATFPAGTLSGAPKVRAMELIDSIEPTRRGVYGGAVGYFDFSGDMDVCIAIRTALAHNGRFYVQAGAGLVADSHPETEYNEAKNKASGVIAACIEESHL